jgi:secretion/DNA translocation related CpaE-like protein
MLHERPPAPVPLVITRDPAYRHDLIRLCAAAATDPEVVGDPSAASRAWIRASCVLVGSDCADDVAALRLRPRADVVLIGRGQETTQLWRRAVRIRADDVAVLPDAADVIAERVADAGFGSSGLVLGVVGAGCGAGASTVAASLATVSARRGETSLLVDADLMAGGAELLMGCESAPGLRWPDLDLTGEGRIAPDALLAALPAVDGVRVLSAGRTGLAAVTAAAMQTVVATGRRGCDLVVLDLPRRADAWFAEIAAELDACLVVVSTEIRSVAAARQVIALAQTACRDVRVVARLCRPRQFDPQALDDALGAPVAAVVPTSRAVRRAVNDGSGVVVGRRAVARYSLLLDGVRGGREAT